MFSNLLATPGSSLIAPLLLSLCVLQTACGGGSSGSDAPQASSPAPTTPAPTTDTDAPSIITRSPGNQVTDVSINAEIVVEFNEALDPANMGSQDLMLTLQAAPIDGAVTYDSAAKTLSFRPQAPLTADTVYGVSVASSIQDTAGNPFLGDSWFFTTGGPFNLGATTQSTMDQCMDDGDKQMLTLVNNARGASRTCGTDEYVQQSALAWNCMLDQSSLDHSTSMANNDFHEHVSPVDGTDPGDRIRAAGYTPQAWGENIAAGYDSEEEVMAGWLASAGHCANLMSSAFTQMGAADASNPASTFGRYWTQNFGRPSS